MRDWVALRLAFTASAAAVAFGLFMAAPLTAPEHRLASVLSGTVGALTVSYVVAVASTWKPWAKAFTPRQRRQTNSYFGFAPRAREDEPPYVRLPRKRSGEGGQ